MSSARYLPKNDYIGLKAAFRRLVVMVGGGNEAAAQTRVGQQAMDRYGSVSAEHEERFAPVDVIADLEAACGDPVVTRKLAELSGHVLIPLPPVTASTCRIDMLTANAVAKFGQMLTELATARADGDISEEEARALRPQIAELITKLVKLDREIELLATDEDRP